MRTILRLDQPNGEIQDKIKKNKIQLEVLPGFEPGSRENSVVIRISRADRYTTKPACGELTAIFG